jgi:hypothetical protein
MHHSVRRVREGGSGFVSHIMPIQQYRQLQKMYLCIMSITGIIDFIVASFKFGV